MQKAKCRKHGQGRGFGVVGQGLADQRHAKLAKLTLGVNLVNVVLDARVCHQHDLRVIESQAGQRNGRSDVGIFGVKTGCFACTGVE